MSLQSLLESANPYHSVQGDAARLASKWEKTGLLEGLNGTHKNNMSIILENQAKQLVVETSQTGGGSQSVGSFTAGVGEQWAGVALPLVRKVFGQIAAKEFVSVQPMNLPAGLVFFLDFQYGNTKTPFTVGNSLYGTNTANFGNAAAGALYGSGRFGYSINQYTASVTNAGTGSATWADFNFDSNYSASAASSQYKKVLVPLPSNYDVNGVRAFVFTSASTIAATDVLQAFTTVTNNTASFIVTGSLIAANMSPTAATVTLFYDVQPAPDARGDFEDGKSKTNAPTTIDIPSIDVQLKSEAIVAKTRKLKAQWTPEFAQDLNSVTQMNVTDVVAEKVSGYDNNHRKRYG